MERPRLEVFNSGARPSKPNRTPEWEKGGRNQGENLGAGKVALAEKSDPEDS